ncbi:hypothetical protein [Pseudaestuariivita rosea]|uniref:hypothetical protein n=1 Tax=Pseudaestuariivita rosea TaxID=2763263 RepID=UPI001ABA8061|nr:hypothetical protein [Pseudaestuariivita rosea]
MIDLQINTGNADRPIYQTGNGHNLFNQLAVKVDMDRVEDDAYFAWLNSVPSEIDKHIPGVSFLERDGVRHSPPTNIAVYYDTHDYQLLPTGALLRTSCSKLTHAFCAFKMAEDEHGNRLDRRHVFEGDKKATIQREPYSPKSIKIVNDLLIRTDIEQPGYFLQREMGIDPIDLKPALILFGRRSTFFVRIDDYDVLRCSIDRSAVSDFRKDPECLIRKEFREVELSIYPRIPAEISGDERVISTIAFLRDSLLERFQTRVTYDIKYQRGAKILQIAN